MTFNQDMTVPEPPRDPMDGRIRGRRVAAGIGLAVLGHLLVICLGVAIGAASTNVDALFGYALPLAELALLAACLTLGILGIVRGDGGLGLGIIIGWAAGFIVLPVVGIGVCLVLVTSGGMG